MVAEILADFVSIQFCCDKWRLYEATGNDLSVTDFVGDSSPETAKSLFVTGLNSYRISLID